MRYSKTGPKMDIVHYSKKQLLDVASNNNGFKHVVIGCGIQ